MTTIVYKDGVIAYDSRSTQGDLITDDNAIKRHKVNGANYFVAGAIADAPILIGLDNGDKPEIPDHASALKVKGNQVSFLGMNKQDGFWSNPIDKNKTFAIGSGHEHAFTAMDMGATAKEAVKMAAKRDTGTGGKIRTFKVK